MVELWPICYVGQFMIFNQEVVYFMYLPYSHETCVDLYVEMAWFNASGSSKDTKVDKNLLNLPPSYTDIN